MKKIDLGQLTNTLANLGVIAGIVFLAIEIRQNNMLMQSQTRSEIANSVTDLMKVAAVSDYVAEVSPAELIEQHGVDGRRFYLYSFARLRIWENIHYQWTKGLYEDTEFFVERDSWEPFLNQPSVRETFCYYRESLSSVFRAELDGMLLEPCGD